MVTPLPNWHHKRPQESTLSPPCKRSKYSNIEDKCTLNSTPTENIATTYTHDSQTLPIIVGRTDETTAIQQHLSQILVHGRPAFLYICGTPGSGKTALTSKLLHQLQECASEPHQLISPDALNLKTTDSAGPNAHFSRHFVILNCATQLNTKPLFEQLAERLLEASHCPPLPSHNLPGEQQLQAALSHITAKHQEKWECTKHPSRGPLGKIMFLLLLDEIDQLSPSHNKALYRLIELIHETHECLSTIALANTYDLYETQLKSLSSQNNTGPMSQVIRFKPYDAMQLADICRQSIAPLHNIIFEENALKFLCGKVSKLSGEQAGDVRVLLDITKKAAFTIQKSCTDLTKQHQCSKDLPIIDIHTIIEIWRERMKNISTKCQVVNLSLFQRIALASIIQGINTCKDNASHVQFEVVAINYKNLSSKLLGKYNQLELIKALALIESTGMISLKKKRTKPQMIKLKVNLNETWNELREDLVIKTLL